MEAKNKLNSQTANETNPAKTINTAIGNTPAVKGSYPDLKANIPEEKFSYSDVSVKKLLMNEIVQKAIKDCIFIPKVIIPKKVKRPYKNDETKATTQKVEALSGTTIENAVSIELTLLGIELDPVEAVNKKYRIIDYTLALEANMTSGKFSGYAATGLKLIVTRLEEVKGDE